MKWVISFMIDVYLVLVLVTTVSNSWETSLFSRSYEKSERIPNVLLFDHNDYHSEVRLAIFQALISLPVGTIQLTIRKSLFQEHLIFNEIYGDAINGTLTSKQDWIHHETLRRFAVNTRQPLTAILPTCENVATALHYSFKPTLRNYQTICFSHKVKLPGTIYRKEKEKRIRKFNYTFLTLAPHVATGLENHITAKMNISPKMYTFVPVFEFNRSVKFGKNWLSPTIVVQGGIKARRRNYHALFDAMRKYLPIYPHIKMQFIGLNIDNVKVPGDLTNNIDIYSELPYPEYYNLISKAVAIFPAFSSVNNYLRDKASSTIPASIITCVPIVADKEILNSYNYLNESVVWYRNSNETEMDALVRFIQLEEFKQVFIEKRQMLKELRETLIEKNIALMQKIIFRS